MRESKFKEALQQLRAEGRLRELSHTALPSFVHNDYLGLSGHPRLIEAGARSLSQWGAGARGSRLLGGHSPLFERAEEEIAAFFKAPSALLFSSGYMANLAAVTAFGELSSQILSDAKAHASLIDGVRLTGKPKMVVAHNDWRALRSEDLTGVPLFIAESIYSMDGDTADIDALRTQLQASEGFLLLDEAHAAGVFGETGGGLSWGAIDWERTAVTVTFGKAFGVAGAAILCSESAREWLLNRGRSFIYTTAPSPCVVGMIRESLKLVGGAGGLRAELWDRGRLVRNILCAAFAPPTPVCSHEWQKWNEFSPIVPVPIPGNDSALRLSQLMREFGIDLRAIRYPTVAKGEERLRISLNLSVTREQTERMATELVSLWMAYSSQQ